MFSAEPLATYFSHAIKGKFAAARTGRAIVSESCQIPNIRALYDEIGLPPRGYFVEIGAFDGHQFSNTSFLADEGWRGLYVEPIPKFARRTRLRHVFNAVAVENVAIDTKSGSSTIHTMGALSTTRSDVAGAYDTIGWAKDTAQLRSAVTIRTETLESVFQRNEVPQRFDLMVIDTEGTEETIIQLLIQSKYRPRILIVELQDGHSDFESYPELQSSHYRARTYLLENNYRPRWQNAINTLFEST